MENGHEPATKADLRESEERLTEIIRDARTEALKAFYGFAESNRQRVAQLEGNRGALITHRRARRPDART
jgi:hypothetical protein